MEKIGKRIAQFSFGYIFAAFILSMLTLGQWIAVPVADWYWVAYPLFALYWVGTTGFIMYAISEEEKGK